MRTWCSSWTSLQQGQSSSLWCANTAAQATVVYEQLANTRAEHNSCLNFAACCMPAMPHRPCVGSAMLAAVCFPKGVRTNHHSCKTHPYCSLWCGVLQWELISGGDLLELLNECNGCMTETAAAFYYTQLLRGVLHMHVNGYCHRCGSCFCGQRAFAHLHSTWLACAKYCNPCGCVAKSVMCSCLVPDRPARNNLLYARKWTCLVAVKKCCTQRFLCLCLTPCRDIKPENCMIEASTQRLKLIDFGLSKVGEPRVGQ
jgi:hypothetical protein